MATANRRWEFMYDIQFEKKCMYDTSRQILCIVCISSCHIIVTRLNAFTCQSSSSQLPPCSNGSTSFTPLPKLRMPSKGLQSDGAPPSWKILCSLRENRSTKHDCVRKSQYIHVRKKTNITNWRALIIPIRQGKKRMKGMISSKNELEKLLTPQESVEQKRKIYVRRRKYR